MMNKKDIPTEHFWLHSVRLGINDDLSEGTAALNTKNLKHHFKRKYKNGDLVKTIIHDMGQKDVFYEAIGTYKDGVLYYKKQK